MLSSLHPTWDLGEYIPHQPTGKDSTNFGLVKMSRSEEYFCCYTEEKLDGADFITR